MADVNGALEIQMRGHSRKIVCIVIHIMAVGFLAGTAVAAAIVCHHAIAVTEKEQHLVVPVVGRERPTVAENDGLALAPVFVKNFNTVLRFDKAHVTLPGISVRIECRMVLVMQPDRVSPNSRAPCAL